MNKKILYGIIGIVLVGIFVSGYFLFFDNPYEFSGDGSVKVLWVNSYQEDFDWSVICFNSFVQVFENRGYSVDSRAVHINSQLDRSEENLNQKIGEIGMEVLNWKPDLIYASDDYAQDAVAEYIGSDIPIFFSGLNYGIDKYGYGESDNVAGVLEKYDIEAVIDFLENINLKVDNVSVLSDSFPQWIVVLDQLKEDARKLDVDFEWKVVENYEEYKDYILEVQSEKDALILLPPASLKDENGDVVSQEDAIKWITENSNIPDASFFKTMVRQGVLLSVDVSAKEQGEAAGKLAYAVLINGEKPSDLDFEHTTGGEENINLKRAGMLGINREDLPSVVLINSEVYDEFSWE